MAVKFTDTKYYQEIADAIRAKTGSTLKMTPPEMATEIGNIPTGGGDDNLTKYLKGEAISLDDSTVTEIPRYGLASGSNLDGAKIKKLILPGLKTIGYSGMYNIQFTADAEVDLSGLETIEDYGMACNQNWLTANPNGLNIAELNFPALKTIGQYGFQYSTGIGSAGTGGVKKITAHALTKIGNNALQMPSSTSYTPTLEEVDFPAVEYIGGHAFQDQRALKKFVTEGPYYANSSAVFSGCSSLTEFSAKNAKEGVLTEYTFLNCTSLEYADIGKTETLNSDVFNGCMALKYFIMRLSKRKVTATYGVDRALNNCGITASTGWILVPSALLEQYKTDWSTYASRFVALQDYTVDGTITGDLDKTKLETLA